MCGALFLRMCNILMRKDGYDHLAKLLIIGDSGVGKTNILLRFCENNFMSSHLTTIGTRVPMQASTSRSRPSRSTARRYACRSGIRPDRKDLRRSHRPTTEGLWVSS